MKKKTPISKVHGYIRATTGEPVLCGESPLEIAARIIEQRHGFIRGKMSARQFIELHRDFVLETQAPKPKKTPEQLAARAAYVPSAKPKLASTPSVTSDAFLLSFEWRRLRMQALKLHGARCQCCGASALTGAVINVDHIKPRKLFPQLALSLDNLQILCADCNHGKGNWDMTDWRPSMVLNE